MIDVLITHVYDTCRFKHYMKIKFNCDAGIRMAEDVKHGYHIRLNNLPECEVRYLQKSIGGFDKPQICDLKIIKSTPMRPRIKPASFVNDEGRFQKKEEPNELAMYHVVITKITTVEMEATNVQINALLADPNVKSINIQK